MTKTIKTTMSVVGDQPWPGAQDTRQTATSDGAGGHSAQEGGQVLRSQELSEVQAAP